MMYAHANNMALDERAFMNKWKSTSSDTNWKDRYGRLEGGWIGAKSIFNIFQFYGLTQSKFTRCATRWISYKWQSSK
jgi:hypothetical protein